MASSKYTFGSNTFAANMFASGVWRGTGPVPAYLNTTGVFTVTNITATRIVDVSTASEQNLIDLIGTIIYDIQEDNWDSSNYTITNDSSTKTFNINSTSLNTLLNVVATLVSENVHADADLFTATGYTVSNFAAILTFNCSQTSLNEIASVAAALLRYVTAQYRIWPVVLPKRRGVAVIGSSKRTWEAIGSTRRTWEAIVEKTRNV